jgi:chemotaxis signal transduction protein
MLKTSAWARQALDQIFFNHPFMTTQSPLETSPQANSDIRPGLRFQIALASNLAHTLAHAARRQEHSQKVSHRAVEDMTGRTDHSTGAATGQSATGQAEQATSRRERRELLSFKAGPRLLCVLQDEAHGAVEWREPTPLPRAPQAVLGIVSIRGRMFTVLDSLALIGEHVAAAEPDVITERGAGTEQFSIARPSYAFIIPLRGDQQLALASDNAPRAIKIYTDEIETSSGRETGSKALRRIVRDEHQEEMVLLNLQEIFNAAMQGVERRRRRF